MIDVELDLLPEEIDWRDEGCEVFPSCLNCPLPRCLEEQPRGQQRLRMAARGRRMAELRKRGKSVKEIADLFGVSQRTVQRALKNQKPKRKQTVILRSETTKNLSSLCRDPSLTLRMTGGNGSG